MDHSRPRLCLLVCGTGTGVPAARFARWGGSTPAGACFPLAAAMLQAPICAHLRPSAADRRACVSTRFVSGHDFSRAVKVC